ncbi:transposase [Fusobacterium sp. SYSU M8D902]|uniref:transposase n=1 Tax=Fusobacterium sp. SYSU M8D902 TaxID=3159562 RepID=UPI0032E50C27
MANYIVQFPLRVEKYQKDILEKRFSIGRDIYNSLLNRMNKRYKEMIKTKVYREILEEISQAEGSKEKKNLYKRLETIRKENGFNEYSFHKEVKEMQKYFKKNIDSFTAQKIATQVWRAFEKVMYGNGEKIHFKRVEDFKSLEGKSNGTGIRYIDGYIDWKGLRLKVLVDENNHYEQEAMKSEIAYCRLVRKIVRERVKYYTQIVFKGVPPVNVDKRTGEYRERIGSGEVHIGIGKQYLFYKRENEDIKIVELADRVYPLELRRRELTGELKKRERMGYSNGSIRYKRLRSKLMEVYRKQMAVRKYQHECLSNEILKLGDRLRIDRIEDIQDKVYSLGKERMVKITTGGEIGQRAPVMLIDMLERKLKYKE